MDSFENGDILGPDSECFMESKDMAKRITLHVVFHAHLDPVWLWSWQEGVDEVLATFRSACDRLDGNPDIFFTQGEAWCYSQIEKLDPALFERIRKHVESGRWELAGGWWVQPDCNFPELEGFRKQIELGKKYFMSRFKKFPKIGFNPDSFGHSAALPALMRRFGQNRYVMMRPQEHERSLPGRLFRWRGEENGPEATVFRLASSYQFDWETKQDSSVAVKRMNSCISELPEGVTHSLLLAGIGDHGGGPTEELIVWLREHKNAFPGIQLQFSTLERFFNAVEKNTTGLPLVTGELQPHAIGCYSVHRPVKKALLDATRKLSQVETIRKELESTGQKQLNDYWHKMVFHQFHDTIGGTCMPGAYVHIIHELNGAEAFAEELLQYAVRKKALLLPDDPYQRLVLLNASDHSFDGWMECDPFLGWRKALCEYLLLDERGNSIPYQWIPRDIVFHDPGLMRIALKFHAAPGELRVFRFVPVPNFPEIRLNLSSRLSGTKNSMRNSLGMGVSFRHSLLKLSGRIFPMPELVLLRDDSDTWSHGIDRYTDKVEDTARWEAPEVNFSGRFLREMVQRGKIGNSSLLRIFRLYADSSEVHVALRVDWHEKQKILKLVMPLKKAASFRMDGICGGGLTRPMDGKEYPVQGWTHIPVCRSRKLRILSPDIFALDGTPEWVRLTLLRSCMLAQHDPWRTEHACVARFSDRGEHDFRFLFSYGTNTVQDTMVRLAMLRYPMPSANLTRGMKKVY